MELHIAKEYETGVGHIEARHQQGPNGEDFLVSFYHGGGRVKQEWEHSLEEARRIVRLFALRARRGSHFPL